MLDKSEVKVLTIETKRQILFHNKTWQAMCDDENSARPMHDKTEGS